MQTGDVAQEALARATQQASTANYGAIFAGFAEKGIAESDILPRENVFTFHAWKALGRQVRKGEHGVKVNTWVSMRKETESGEVAFRAPRMTTVFHISQTDLIAGTPEQHRADIKQQRANAEKAVVMEQSRDTGRSINAKVCKMQSKEDNYYSEQFTPMGRG